jgi:ABC-type glycerol-3-phosphate transport system substrate-binding protein
MVVKRALAGLCLVVALAVTASVATAAPAAKTILNVVLDHTQLNYAQEVINRFGELHPEVQLELQIAPPDATELQAKLAVQFAAGDPPDILLAYEVKDAAQKGLLVDLGALLDRDPQFKRRFPDIFFSEMRKDSYQGKLWAFPVAVTVSGGMLYRQQYLQEAGVPFPKDGWTKDEFLPIAKKTTVKSADGDYDRMGFNPLKWGWDVWLTYSMGLPLYDPATLEWYPREREALESLQYTVDLIHTHQVGRAIGWKWFANGRVAMMSGSPELYGRELQFDPSDIGYVHWPLWKSGMKPTMPWGLTSVSLGNTRDAKRLALSWEFIKFYTSEEMQLVVAALNPGMIPTNQVAMRGLTRVLPPNLPGRDALLYSVNFIATSPQQAASPPLFWDGRIWDDYDVLVTKALNNEIPPIEAIRQIKEIARAVYKEDGLLK